MPFSRTHESQPMQAEQPPVPLASKRAPSPFVRTSRGARAKKNAGWLAPRRAPATRAMSMPCDVHARARTHAHVHAGAVLALTLTRVLTRARRRPDSGVRRRGTSLNLTKVLNEHRDKPGQ